MLLVAVGGILGALARFAVGQALPHDPGGWVWSTVAVNTAGAFLLCALLPRLAPAVRLPLASGLLASFTTFSGFALDAVLLADAGRPAGAAAYVVVSVVLLLAAGAAGLRISTRWGVRP